MAKKAGILVVAGRAQNKRARTVVSSHTVICARVQGYPREYRVLLGGPGGTLEVPTHPSHPYSTNLLAIDDGHPVGVANEESVVIELPKAEPRHQDVDVVVFLVIGNS